MTRALLDPQAASHLAKVLGMLGSDHDGEVVAAARKAHQLIRRLGLSWPDVIHAPPASRSWLEMAAYCRSYAFLLSDRERDFILNVSRLRWPPSDKQLAWLQSIYARLQGGSGRHER